MKGFFKIVLALNFYLLFFANANAQVNLVPNPSFEDTLSCNITYPQFYAQIWNQYQSCDYYNSIMHPHCPFSALAVPNNVSGFQYPRTGQAYSGFVTYIGVTGNTNYREWLQIKLNDSLIIGKNYCISFYYSRADNVKYATDKLGVYISNNGVNLSASSFIQYNPQITTPNGIALTNAIGWNQFTATYIASGGEKYITIGNFFNDASTTISTISPASNDRYAYYYIDDVSVLSVDSLAYAGSNTIMCGDSTYIGRSSEIGLNDDCIWYVLGNTTPIDTVTGFWAKPSVTTSYLVEQNICGTITSDTVTISVKPRLSLMNFNGSFVACPNDSVQIGQAALPNVIYSWSPSFSLNNTSIAQPNALPPANQIYSVTVVPTSTLYCAGNGTGTVSINIKPTFTMSLLSNTVICLGDSVQIGNAPVTDINYQWQPATEVSNINGSQTYVHPSINTTYSLIAMPAATSNYCTKSDTVSEQISVKPLLNGNVTVSTNPKNACPNQSVQLQATVTNNSGLQWNWKPSGNLNNPTISFPVASQTASTNYTVITTAAGTSNWCGADTSTVYVHIIKLQPNVYAGRDTLVCEGKPANIGSNTSVCTWCAYNWQPTAGLQSPNASYSEVSLSTLVSQTYTLSKTDSCQTTTDIVTVQTKDCTSDSIIISVPNIFTPNGDNKNDTWSMFILNGIDIFDTQTTIYNRWGEKVFESTNIHQDWDGYNIYNAKKCSPDTYFYIISYTDGNINKTITLKGFLELIW